MKVAALILLCFCSFETQFVESMDSALTNNHYYRIYYNRVPNYHRYRSPTMNRLKKSSFGRVYSYTSLGPAFYYHSLYRVVARLQGYSIKTRYSKVFRDCANFNTNEYGDFLGYFGCPLSFEPSNFTYCCGKTDYNYCCSDKSKSNPAAGMEPNVLALALGIGIPLSLAGLIAFRCMVIRIRNTDRNRVSAITVTPVYTVPSVAVTQSVQVSTPLYTQPSACPRQLPAYSAQPPAYSAQPPAYSVQPPDFSAQPPQYSTQQVVSVFTTATAAAAVMSSTQNLPRQP